MNDDDEKKARALQVIGLHGSTEREVRIVEDGFFAGTIEAARWIERWVGASEVARTPGRVTLGTAQRFMERVAKLQFVEAGYKDHRLAETVTEAIRAREAANVASAPEPVLKDQLSRSDTILGLIAKRVVETGKKHGRFASAHEVYGILFEEVAEFFDEVRDDASPIRKIAELVDVATVAIRAAIEMAEALDHEPTEQEIRNA